MSNYYHALQPPYLISTDPALLNLQLVHHYLSTQSHWAQNIPFSIVATSVANSLCFGLYKEQEQIGFARLVTDKATFAYLVDVFVLPEHRGKGLAKWLMEIIHAHPELQGLRGWLLTTSNAHGLYEKFGWQVHQHPEKIMRRSAPKPYGEGR